MNVGELKKRLENTDELLEVHISLQGNCGKVDSISSNGKLRIISDHQSFN